MEIVVTVTNPIDGTEVEVTLAISSNLFVNPDGTKLLNVQGFGSTVV